MRLQPILLLVLLGTLTTLPSTQAKSSSSSSSNASSSSSSKVYTLYHDLNGFIERGTIHLSLDNDNDDDPTTNDASSSSVDTLPHGLSGSVQTTENCINTQSLDGLMERNGFYKLKAVDEHGNSAITSVPVCELLRSNFREELSLTLGPNGELLSLYYSPIVSPLAPSCSSLSPLSDSDTVPEFKTKLTIEGSTPGMIIPLVLPKTPPPPGLIMLGDRSTNKMSSASGNNSDSKEGLPKHSSFLLKYWYIIVPLCFMGLFGGAPEEPQQQQQGQQAPQEAVTARAAAAAAGSAASSVRGVASGVAAMGAGGGGAAAGGLRRGKRS